MPITDIRKTITNTQYWVRGAPSSGSYSSTYIYDGSRRYRNWNRTLDFKKIKLGILPTLPYDDYRYHNDIVTVSTSGPSGNGFLTCSGLIPVGLNLVTSNLNDPFLTALKNRAISKAGQKVGDTSIDLGVAAAEARKTFKMFNLIVKDTSAAVVAIRRGNFKKAANILGLKKVPRGVKPGRRNFESNWLEYRYGWRTFMMDLDGAVRHLAETFVERPPILVAKAREVDSRQVSSTTVVSAWANPPYPSTSVSWSGTSFNRVVTDTFTAELVYKYKINNPTASQLNQLGLVNLANLAWELIPYSFVVDWFVNIQETLQNMSAFIGKTCLDGTLTLIHEQEAVTKPLNIIYQGYTQTVTKAGYTRNWVRSYNRSKVSFLSVVPEFRLNLSVGKLVDAYSLLQVSRRRS